MITQNPLIEEHSDAIESLKSRHPHSIELVEQADATMPQNCYEHAFALDKELAHWVGSLQLSELYVGDKFVVEFLIPKLREIVQEDARDGDLVLYFLNGTPTHAGLINGARIISKWGKGNIYAHELNEVPANYGSVRRYYRKIPGDLATRTFVEYVRCHPDYGAFEELFEEKFGNRYPLKI